MAKMSMNAAEVIAFVLGDNYDDVRDGRYQAGHTTIPVYVVGENYYCCPPLGGKPAKGDEWNWKEVGVVDGRSVYESVPESPYDTEGEIVAGRRVEVSIPERPRFHKKSFKVIAVYGDEIVIGVKMDIDSDNVTPAKIARDRVKLLKE